MLIEIHAIQNHSPSNLNRDDLGAPKTCFFGGVLRSRISSQCLKRSIRRSDEFKLLCGGIRTRRLPQHLAQQIKDKDVLPLATAVVQKCGLLHDEERSKKKDVIVFVSTAAVDRMAKLLSEAPAKAANKDIEKLARQFAECIAEERYAPDMALSGRMLEPAKPPRKRRAGEPEGSEEEAEDDGKGKGVWQGLDLTIEAALQVAHAISTHEARPEVDYFVAADDIKGADAGGAHIGEALMASACFYKYFCLDWDQLVHNLAGSEPDRDKDAEGHRKWEKEIKPNAERLAAHTVGALIRGAARVNPSGKQNSFAAHNPPDGMLIEIKNTPISYANAFANPAAQGERDIITQSIAQLGQYIHDLDTGYGKPQQRFWFSPNLRYRLSIVENEQEIVLAENNLKSLDDLIPAVIAAIGHDWRTVQEVVVNQAVTP